MSEEGDLRPSILVVDDDLAGLSAIEMLLEDPGYDRVTASSGREALRRCLDTEFALILMDVRMPEMDGFETASLLRSHHRFRETPIIFLTADPHGDAQRLRGYELGAVDYLTKPVEPVALRAKVSVFVALWRRTLEVRQQGDRLRELEARELRRELEARAQATLSRADARVRAALEREAMVFHAVPIVLYTRRVGAEPRVEWVSASAERVLGYPAEAFADGAFWQEHVHPDDIPDVVDGLRHLAAGEAPAALTWRWRMPDGTERWFLEQPVLSRDGGEVVGTWLDIDRQKRLEEELRRANEDLDRRVRERTAELEHSIRQLESFSYSVAHDLRSPLRAMHGFSRILVDACRDDLSPEALDAQSRLVSAVSRMERLIDDLLELARVSRRPIARAPVDLASMTREIVTALRERDPERDVSLRLPEHLVVDADPHLVRIALENLIGNAWKFSRPRDSATIELGVSPETDRIYVRDNGVGFDPTHATRLFEPFERLHGSGEFDGTGIGLATVRRIVERHGGEILAEARPGEGATFWFTLRPHAEGPSAGT